MQTEQYQLEGQKRGTSFFAISKYSYVLTLSWPTLNLFRDVWRQKLLLKEDGTVRLFLFMAGNELALSVFYVTRRRHFHKILLEYCQKIPFFAIPSVLL